MLPISGCYLLIVLSSVVSIKLYMILLYRRIGFPLCNNDLPPSFSAATLKQMIAPPLAELAGMSPRAAAADPYVQNKPSVDQQV
jgi:hypothetical protein